MTFASTKRTVAEAQAFHGFILSGYWSLKDNTGFAPSDESPLLQPCTVEIRILGDACSNYYIVKGAVAELQAIVSGATVDSYQWTALRVAGET